MILQPPSVLIIGPGGSGKTYSIATQLLCGLEVFVIVTEPGGVDSLLDAAERLKAPIDNLHWTYCPPTSTGWMAMEDMISKISSHDQKMLADLKDLGKAGFRPAAMRFLDALRNFHCDRTGRDFGDVTSWDDYHSLNIDSLTGWCLIGFGATVGYKPTANPGEWGIAQNFIYNMLVKINTDRKCFFSLTAHPEKEIDEMSGVRKIMVSAIGAKLAPKIPPFFSEVVAAKRTLDSRTGAAKFTWSTIASDQDLKNRALPISTELSPDFRPVFDAYKRRRDLAGGTQMSPPPTKAPPPPSPKPGAMPLKPIS